MDFRLIGRLAADKLRDRTTYAVALVVGILINVYGQLLVPWFRTSQEPFTQFLVELQTRPALTLSSVFLAFAFPLGVGIYSAVAARYKNRRVESIADFPERKPDPVFRARLDGRLVEVGARTQAFFEQFQIASAQQIVGEEGWGRIASGQPSGERMIVYFAAEGERYLVAHAPTRDNEINVYMTRLSGLRVEH